jgi:hypothetical protein
MPFSSCQPTSQVLAEVSLHPWAVIATFDFLASVRHDVLWERWVAVDRMMRAPHTSLHEKQRLQRYLDLISAAGYWRFPSLWKSYVVVANQEQATGELGDGHS